MNAATEFDLGPLTWVKGEIDLALERADEALRQYNGGADSTQLKYCRTHVHQVHGALAIVGLDGVTQVTESLECLLLGLEDGTIQPTADHQAAVGQATAAIRQYLDDLMAGEPNQPLRLLPVYRTLAAARGQQPARATDLFYPDLSLRPPKRAGATVRLTTDEVDKLLRSERTRFQKGLLTWLRKPEAADEGLAQMRQALSTIEATQESPAARSFWWVSQGFLESLADRNVASELEARQLCARIDLQIRRLLEGSRNVAERLLRDALYYVAQAPAASGDISRAVRSTFSLDELVPATAAAAEAPAPREALLRKLREAIATTEESWNKFCSGSSSMLNSFAEQARNCANLTADIGHTDLKRLGQGLGAIATWLVEQPSRHSESVAMEVATAILLLQNAQENFRRLGTDFAQQVDLMVARIHGCISGKPAESGDEIPLLDEMTRRAQEKLLIGQVAREIQNNLAQVEQALDAFFRSPDKNAELGQLQSPLKQIAGALTILGHDAALTALQRCEEQIRGFASSGYTPNHDDFESVAHELSLLGFFVDSLQHGSADYDTFVRNLKGEKPAAAEEEEEVHDLTAAPSVEAQLEQQKKETQALLEALKEKPQDDQLKTELKQNLQALQKDADLVADHGLGETAKAALSALESGETEAAEFDAAITMLMPVGMETPEPSAETLQLAQSSHEEIDAELLSIFLEEAKEVLATMAENYQALSADPHDIEALTTIRRSTHTLKGSGRMVGLKDLGEAAWALEQTYNNWLRQELGVTPNLLEMIRQQQELFSVWVDNLEKNTGRAPDPSALVALAERLREGDTSAASTPAELVEPLEVAEPPPATAQIIELPTAAAARPAPVEVVTLEPSPVTPLHGEPSFNEIQVELGTATNLGFEFNLDEHAPDMVATQIVQPSMFATFEEPPAREEPAHVEALVAPPAEPPIELLGAPAEEIESFTVEELPELPELTEEFEAEPTPEAATSAELTAPSEVIDLAPTEPIADEPIAEASEVREAEESITEDIVVAEEETSVPSAPTLFDIFREEARGHLDTLTHSFAILEAAPRGPTTFEMTRAAHTLGGIAATVGLTPINKLAIALEHALLRRDHSSRPDSIEGLETVRQTILGLEDMFAALAEQRSPEPLPVLTDALDQIYPPAPPEEEPVAEPEPVAPPPGVEAPVAEPLAAAPIEVPVPAPAAAAPLRLKDELDEQLLPIFLEEAQDLLRGFDEQLRSWREQPQEQAPQHALARLLHTFKGSARMAGAMNLGELTHHLESRVEEFLHGGATGSAHVDEIQAGCDTLVQIVDRLLAGESPELPPPAAVAEASPVSELTVEPAAAPVAVQPVATTPAAAMPTHHEPEHEFADRRATVRVRADLIDRLVNEAGELSIARARIEGEMRSLKVSLLDLTENVIRLRRQLRDIEIQAETQIQARVAQSHDGQAEFDPLELDRFTRFQELTRFMAESVNDVATVQQNLLKNLDDANAAILAQARLNRSLQQELMGVRMLPFASQAERLYRIVRQTSKEVGKRANLDIRGGQVEIDRSILDKMLAPLEHMLRNAIAHGIESREERAAAGKPEFGEVNLSLQQEGNEIIIAMADDGRGLDASRIRARAEGLGLLAPDEAADNAKLFDFIFQPGFSTASEVTQVAGRGVGMDVVKTEVAALGGRIETLSAPGQGTTFRLYLPLTLAVTQTLLVRVGGQLYAIPSTMIEQVLEVKEKALQELQEKGEAEWMHNRYPFYFLPRLLGDAASLPETHRQYWVLLLRSGSQRVAIHVDELKGNEEVVVKNIGPQLARIVGIAGATVLGDGQVVLILNPVALASRTPVTAAPGEMLAPVMPEAVPAPAATLPTVLVVDDSLTVRKITGRLLAREGYQVVVAKDGVDALEQMLEIIPDVIISDIEMPRMDGFDLVRNIRADDRLKKLPVIMITSRTAEKHRNYAFEIGANHYLGKPYDEEELLGLIAAYVRAKRAAATAS